jgi:hypothetical protein
MARLTFALLLLSGTCLFAQDHKAEIFVGPMAANFAAEYDLGPNKNPAIEYVTVDARAIGPQVKFLFHLTPRIMAGAMFAYGKGSKGKFTFHQEPSDVVMKIDSKQQFYGLQLQWGTARHRAFMFYTHINLKWSSLNDKVIGFDPPTSVDQNSITEFKRSGYSLGLGFGFIVRISRHIKFNIADLDLNFNDRSLSYDAVTNCNSGLLSSSIILNVIRDK